MKAALVNENLHLVLYYVDVANRSSSRLSPDQLDAFAASPRPRPAERRNTTFITSAILTEFMQGAVFKPGETIRQFLLRVEWIVQTDDTVTLTALGRAVLSDAERPQIAASDDEPISVTIDPNDPVAYTRLFQLLSNHGAGLLVDRYLTLEGLADLVDISLVDRILTGDDSTRNRLQLFAHALSAMDSPPALRAAPAVELHDRFFIPDDGPIFVLGSSLNSIAKRPGVITTVADTAGASAVRSTYNEIWSRATVVERSPVRA